MPSLPLAQREEPKGLRATAPHTDPSSFRPAIEPREQDRETFNLKPGDLRVCPIRDQDDLEQVYRLTHEAYLQQGYCHPQPFGRLVHYPHLEGIPETTVLVALLDGTVVGTNSLTLDGPRGLHVDQDFRTECDLIRAEGRRLAASWRIATREDLHSGTRVVMSLIRETVRLVWAQAVENVVFTFNPRHERIYKRLLNMETVARRDRSVDALVNAPAVLMRVRVEDIPARWLEPSNLLEFGR